MCLHSSSGSSWMPWWIALLFFIYMLPHLRPCWVTRPPQSPPDPGHWPFTTAGGGSLMGNRPKWLQGLLLLQCLPAPWIHSRPSRCSQRHFALRIPFLITANRSHEEPLRLFHLLLNFTGLQTPLLITEFRIQSDFWMPRDVIPLSSLNQFSYCNSFRDLPFSFSSLYSKESLVVFHEAFPKTKKPPWTNLVILCKIHIDRIVCLFSRTSSLFEHCAQTLCSKHSLLTMTPSQA